MAIIKNPITVVGGGGDVVNGVIERYKASTSTISANTFVEFVQTITSGVPKALHTGNGGYIDVARLDASKVFVAYEVDSVLYGVVCTISGTTFSIGTRVQIASDSTYLAYPNVCELSSKSVAVIYQLTSNTGPVKGNVCTISGTTITVGTQTSIATASYRHVKATTCSSTAVAVCYGKSSSNNSVVLQKVSISGTTMTVGTAVSMGLGPTYGFSVAALSATSFIFCGVYAGTSLAIKLVSASDTTLTIEKESTNVGAPELDYPIGILPFDGSVVGIFLESGFNNQSKPNIQRGVRCLLLNIASTSEFSIMDYRPVYIDRANHSFNNIPPAAACKMFPGSTSKGIVSFLRGSGSVITLHAFTVELSNNTNLKVYESVGIRTHTTSAISNYAKQYGLAPMSNGTVFFGAFNNNGETGAKENGTVCTVNSAVQPSSAVVDGITKTECTTSTAGDVWVLNN